MTIEQFLEKLRETPRDWALDDNARIRCRKGCPITAVEGTATRTWGAQLRMAISNLQMSEGDADAIVSSADDMQDNDCFVPSLRKQLLDACGLSADQPSPETV